MSKFYYTKWVWLLAPWYCAMGAYSVSVLCRAFRASRSAALWPIPLLGFIGCVATGCFFTLLLGPELRQVGIDTPESDAWVRGQFREAIIVAVVPAVVVVWHQLRKQIAMHPRPGRGTVAAVLDQAVLQYGFIFVVQCFVAGQAVAWPMIKRGASWVPEWWQSEALAYLGWMVPAAPAYLVGEVLERLPAHSICLGWYWPRAPLTSHCFSGAGGAPECDALPRRRHRQPEFPGWLRSSDAGSCGRDE